MELKDFIKTAITDITEAVSEFRTLRGILVLIVIVVMLPSCGRHHKQTKHKVDSDCVYVCSGHSVKRYHSVGDCRGLSNCSGEILEMTVEEAEDEGKTPCRMCVKQ